MHLPRNLYIKAPNHCSLAAPGAPKPRRVLERLPVREVTQPKGPNSREQGRQVVASFNCIHIADATCFYPSGQLNLHFTCFHSPAAIPQQSTACRSSPSNRDPQLPQLPLVWGIAKLHIFHIFHVDAPKTSLTTGHQCSSAASHGCKRVRRSSRRCRLRCFVLRCDLRTSGCLCFIEGFREWSEWSKWWSEWSESWTTGPPDLLTAWGPDRGGHWRRCWRSRRGRGGSRPFHGSLCCAHSVVRNLG